jgi:molecular chaperone HscB
VSDRARSGAERRDSDVACWSCGASVAALAMFCHACGALQPPRGEDHFARLGLTPRFDIDPGTLDRQYAGFRARLPDERFAKRSALEKTHAALHREALDRARAVVADPWQRARHLLALRSRQVEESAGPDLAPEASMTRAKLVEASHPAELVPLIEDATERMALCYTDLTAAFRRDDLDRAQRLAGEIGRLRRLIAEARQRRSELGSG